MLLGDAVERSLAEHEVEAEREVAAGRAARCLCGWYVSTTEPHACKGGFRAGCGLVHVGRCAGADDGSKVQP